MDLQLELAAEQVRAGEAVVLVVVVAAAARGAGVAAGQAPGAGLQQRVGGHRGGVHVRLHPDAARVQGLMSI